MWRSVCLLGILAGCDDHLFPGHAGGGTTPTGTGPGAEGWCAVDAMIRAQCLSCHSAAVALGGLDLETDPHGTLLASYVVSGDPDGSLLVRKLTGELGAGEGGIMPPGTGLPAAAVDRVRAWIAEGADSVCDGGTTTPTTPPVRYHPEGWAEPASHGMAAKLGQDDCRACHGADLTGGKSVGCDTCHAPDWATDCTFCHGSAADDQPAPPQDIDDQDDPAAISFPAHLAHVTETETHAAWDCTMCHTRPDSALTPGHLFDDATSGIAEVQFDETPATGASYAAGTCSDVWCHGNGQAAGSASVDGVDPGDGTLVTDIGCGFCHAVASRAGWQRLSGRHFDHLDNGVTCGECHPTVDGPPYELVDKERHLDGAIAVQPAGTIVWDGTTCEGTCHQEQHDGREWIGDDDRAAP